MLQSCYKPALSSPSTECELVEIYLPNPVVLVLLVLTALKDKSHLHTRVVLLLVIQYMYQCLATGTSKITLY